MYFVKTVIPNAILRIQAGEYEVSLSGDDSCGAMPHYGRLDIRVYDKMGNCVEEFYSPKFDDLARIVKKYENY